MTIQNVFEMAHSKDSNSYLVNIYLKNTSFLFSLIKHCLKRLDTLFQVKKC